MRRKKQIVSHLIFEVVSFFKKNLLPYICRLISKGCLNFRLNGKRAEIIPNEPGRIMPPRERLKTGDDRI